MDRCAVFVDAGYLLAAGGDLCCGTTDRSEVSCNYETLVDFLVRAVSDDARMPVLRVYWYDAAPNALPLTDHQEIAQLANVKLRLGRLTGGKQKGVDSLIIRDLMTLARERAIATAYLISGDEDIREGVVAAQDMGVRVVLLGIPPASQRFNQARTYPARARRTATTKRARVVRCDSQRGRAAPCRTSRLLDGARGCAKRTSHTWRANRRGILILPAKGLRPAAEEL